MLNIPLCVCLRYQPFSLAIPLPKVGSMHPFPFGVYSHFQDSTLRTFPLECSQPAVKHTHPPSCYIFLAETVSYFPLEYGTNGTTTVVSFKGLPKYCSKAPTQRHQSPESSPESNKGFWRKSSVQR